MERAISFVLVIVMMLALLSSCGEYNVDGNNVNSSQNTTAATTPSATDPEPEIKEPFFSNDIIKDGASDYVIVHDGTAETMSFAAKIKAAVLAEFGLTLEAVSSSAREEGDFEIVLGKARECAKNTAEKLEWKYDFALKVEDKKIVLCANNDVSYLYFAEYLAREVFKKDEAGNLVLDSEDNIVYSDSSLAEKNYIEYMTAGKKGFSLALLCAKEVYKNSNTSLPYRIYVPFNYDPEKSYPIFVNLHGAGHRGSDNEKHLGFVTNLLTVEDLPLDDSIIIFPQCPENNQWVDTPWANGSYSVDAVPESNELKALAELIEQIKKDYSVDEKRIYACGLSMGGYGVWDLLMRHSDLFAGGVAMCGAADPSKAETLVDMPIWAIHGAKDPTVPVSGSREITEAIKNAGGTKIKYTELANNQHDVWSYTYSNYSIFLWLFSQTKG